MKDKAKVEEEKKDEEKEDPKGIPEFWLTVFKNVDLLSDMLQVQVILSHTHTHTHTHTLVSPQFDKHTNHKWMTNNSWDFYKHG